MLSRLTFRVFLAALLVSLAPAQQFDEYQVKAAFVANFTGFIEWPAAAFHSASDPFTICVVGRNPFGHSLADVIAGKTAVGRPLRVSEIADVTSAASCQIAFVSSSERLRYRAILETFKDSSTLTIGDTRGFIAEGGIIALLLDNGKIRMQINVAASKERSLRISSHLLSLAEGSK